MTRLGKYFTLEEFCTCTHTYQKYRDKIDNLYPQNQASIDALIILCQLIVDPIIDYFGRDNFLLTYGFCSPRLQYFLQQKDVGTGKKNGRIDPSRDQHMAHELNSQGNYYCKRLGAACDFKIIDRDSNLVIDWIVDQQLPFDSLYYYGVDRPIHISYGKQNKRDIWTFLPTGQPTKKGTEAWCKNVARTSSD
jgi:hypothetical protein